MKLVLTVLAFAQAAFAANSIRCTTPGSKDEVNLIRRGSDQGRNVFAISIDKGLSSRRLGSVSELMLVQEFSRTADILADPIMNPRVRISFAKGFLRDPEGTKSAGQLKVGNNDLTDRVIHDLICNVVE